MRAMLGLPKGVSVGICALHGKLEMQKGVSVRICFSRGGLEMQTSFLLRKHEVALRASSPKRRLGRNLRVVSATSEQNILSLHLAAITK